MVTCYFELKQNLFFLFSRIINILMMGSHLDCYSRLVEVFCVPLVVNKGIQHLFLDFAHQVGA